MEINGVFIRHASRYSYKIEQDENPSPSNPFKGRVHRLWLFQGQILQAYFSPDNSTEINHSDVFEALVYLLNTYD